jgi:hypothetical protein
LDFPLLQGEFDELKKGGLQEKRAVAAWNFGSASQRLFEENQLLLSLFVLRSTQNT